MIFKIRQGLGLGIAALIGIFLALWVAQIREVGLGGGFSPQPAIAQFVRPQYVAPAVYEQLPNLPLENTYLNQETGEVDSNNTLVSRLIRYHLYVKSRTPSYRLDWKLTVADYLDAHERLVATNYPGHSSLTPNPMEGDRTVIVNLTRTQRNELVQVLVNIFNPNAANIDDAVSLPEASDNSNGSRVPTSPRRNQPSLPQSGDADLLKL